MITDEQLESLIKKQKKEKGLTKEEKKENNIKWITFFRKNPDIFNEDFLEIKNMCTMQHQIINMVFDNDISTIVMSRGGSKSFCIGLAAIDYCLMYPNSTVGITSLTLGQSNLIITEKIDRIFCKEGTAWSSPVLCQMRKEGYIRFTSMDTSEAKVVEFGNGSKILAIGASDGSRGSRLNFVIVDEYPLVKKVDLDRIILPMLEVRHFGGRPKDYPEETKQAYLSSARTKSNWGWKHLVNTVNMHYKNEGKQNRSQYGFFAGDIFTAVANGIQTKKQYLQRKKDTDDLSFEQEYLNIWLSENENSIFKFSDFEQCQVLEEGFRPRTPIEILENEHQKYEFDDENTIRILIVDIALATGKDNDNTIVAFVELNKKTGVRKFLHWESKYGENTLQQVIFLKRMFYEFKASYTAIDVAGVGRALGDVLSSETYDPETDMTYPAWNLADDPDIQVASDIVVDDIRKRAFEEGQQVIIPITGSAQFNTSIHLSARKNLKNDMVQLLVDDTKKKIELEDNDPNWLAKTAEEKADILLPYVQTRFMINEAVSLDTVFTETGNIKLKEHTRTSTKDRYIVFAYGNLVCDTLYNKYAKSDDEDCDISEFSWLGNSIF